MARWFRFYDDAMDDPKVLMLSDAHYRAWTMLLCVASKNDGKISDDMKALALYLRKPVGKVAGIIQILLDAQLLDETETGFTPHNWNGRQYKSDVSTERVKRFRGRSSNGNETANETPPEADTETNTETKKKDKRAALARFDDFWNACPKKSGKGGAEKAWLKAVALAPPDTLIAAMRAYAAGQSGKDPAYIKTPGPWLNDKRWLDETSIVTNGGAVDHALAEAQKIERDAIAKMLETAGGNA